MKRSKFGVIILCVVLMCLFCTGSVWAGMVPRYRLYNPNNFHHHYTTDPNEYQVLGSIGWIQEGAACYLYNEMAKIETVDTVSYYRLYNPNSFEHHWTTDANEYRVLGTIGWIQEGVDGYVFASQVSGSEPLYRLYNPNNGLHLWTMDANEKNVLIGYGFIDEGIACYVFAQNPENQLSIRYGYIQYRSFGDDYSKGYRGWIELVKGNDPIEASDITGITVKDNSGVTQDVHVTSLITTDYYFGNYNTESGDLDFAGPYYVSGYSIHYPANDALAAGDYIFEVNPAQGDVITQTFNFPETLELPVVDSTTMTYRWAEGALILSWVAPMGTFDNFQVVLMTPDREEFLYVKAPKTVTSINIPKDWVERLATLTPIQDWLWQLQTRAFTEDGMNHARGYSRRCKIYPAGEESDFYINWRRLQYRTRSNPDNNGYANGLIILKTDGTLVDQPDITRIDLKNSDGVNINDENIWYYREEAVFYARVFEGSSSLFNKGADKYSYFSVDIPPTPALVDGKYSYEVTTIDGSLLTSTLEYPGDLESPIPDSTKMTYQWLGDGSLKLTWENPAGEYEQIRLVGWDPDAGEDLFYIRTPTNINTVNLPKWAVDEMIAMHGTVPIGVYWSIETRTYGNYRFDYARGKSDSVEILNWPQN